jgi:hypothetical protein
MAIVKKIAMSTTAQKILDSNVGKFGVKVGNKVIKGVKAVTPSSKKIVDDLFGSPERDARQKKEAKKLNRASSGKVYKR